MMDMQMDGTSMHAESIMPNLLNWLEDSLSMEEVEFSSEMNSWNYEMNADLKQPGFIIGGESYTVLFLGTNMKPLALR